MGGTTFRSHGLRWPGSYRDGRGKRPVAIPPTRPPRSMRGAGSVGACPDYRSRITIGQLMMIPLEP